MIHAENRRSAVRKIRGVAYALTLVKNELHKDPFLCVGRDYVADPFLRRPRPV